MTIEKGQDWGRPYESQVLVESTESDKELAAKVAELLANEDRHRGAPAVAFTVRSGDVAGSLGFSQPVPDDTNRPMLYPMDLGWAEFGSEPEEVSAELPFVAHVIGHGHRYRRWRWPKLAVMNAPLRGPERLGPRAHLNDGLLDVTTGELPWRQTWEARRRARTGTHLPHPNLKTTRTPLFEYVSDQSLTFAVDGRDCGSWSWTRFSIVPDAFDLVMPSPS